jgi:hypothetical protein
MKWKDIKEQIEAGGVTDDMQVWFIDINDAGDLSVCPEEDEKGDPNYIGFSVTN